MTNVNYSLHLVGSRKIQRPHYCTKPCRHQKVYSSNCACYLAISTQGSRYFTLYALHPWPFALQKMIHRTHTCVRRDETHIQRHKHTHTHSSKSQLTKKVPTKRGTGLRRCVYTNTSTHIQKHRSTNARSCMSHAQQSLAILAFLCRTEKK